MSKTADNWWHLLHVCSAVTTHTLMLQQHAGTRHAPPCTALLARSLNSGLNTAPLVLWSSYFEKIFYVSFEKYLLGDILRFWENVYSFVVIRYKIFTYLALLASTDLATITALSLALSRTTIKRFEFNLLFTLYLEWTN